MISKRIFFKSKNITYFLAFGYLHWFFLDFYFLLLFFFCQLRITIFQSGRIVQQRHFVFEIHFGLFQFARTDQILQLTVVFFLDSPIAAVVTTSGTIEESISGRTMFESVSKCSTKFMPRWWESLKTTRFDCQKSIARCVTNQSWKLLQQSSNH